MQATSLKNGRRTFGFRAGRELIRRDTGGSLVELALLMSVFGPLAIFGLVEIGGLAYQYIEVCDAARAGAAYAAQYYHANSSLPTQAYVSTAISDDAKELQLKSGTSLPASPEATGCTGGSATTGTTVPTCASPSQPYVQVKVTATVVPPVVNALFSASITMTDTAQMVLTQ